MPNSNPTVSILIPTYNQEKFIDTCVTSALNQTYDNLEVIVSDDASDDATREVVGRALADPRLRYERNATNIGRVSNYRRLLCELASGDWVLMLDGDDYFINPEYVADAVELALSAPDVVLVFGKLRQGPDEARSKASIAVPGLQPLMDGTEFFLQHPPFYDATPHHMTCLFRRTAAIRSQFYRHDILSTDLESFYRLMIGHKIGYLDEVAGLWRQHDDNASKNSSYHACASNLTVFTGPFQYAASLGIFSRAELNAWLRKGATRYFLLYLGRMLADARLLDAVRFTGYMITIDLGIAGHAIGRVVRWMLRRRTHRPNSG
jgi:glycosyltransferase involved in cell wall biosynthesis